MDITTIGTIGLSGRTLALYKTLALYERVLGADHPSTLVARNNLAADYRAGCHLDRAVPLYEHSLAEYERVLGADHPSTLAARNNLAGAYGAVEDFGRATPCWNVL